MMMIFCSNKWFFVHYKLKFEKYNSFPAKVTFKLVGQGNNLKRNKFDFFFLVLPHFYKLQLFPSTFSVLINSVAKFLFPLELLSITFSIFRLRFPYVKIPNIIQEYPGFQNKHFNLNFIRIREGRGEGRVGRGYDFTMQSIFWSILTKKNA